MNQRIHSSAIVILACLITAKAPAAEVVPGSISIGLQSVFNTFGTGISGVSVPIDMNRNGDGKLYVAAISGQVIASDSGGESLFLDLASNPNVRFTSLFAGGLMGIAFHPDYLNSESSGYHKFYTYSSDLKTTTQVNTSNITPGNQLTGLPDFWSPEMYAPATSGNPLTNWTNPDSPSSGNTQFDHFNIIREWSATTDGSTIDASIAPREILRMGHGFSGKGSHNGGGFRFGPDGYLYLSTGDGGGNAGQDHDGGINNGEDGHTNGIGNAQDRTVVYGKVLRIDPTASVKNSANGQYGIPADNPYVVDNSNPNFVDEIYAYGFRNPWKLDFDDAPGGDGSLYLANVGQHHREEIDLITVGGNYGWGYLEGNVRLVSEDSATGAPDPGDLADGTNGTPVRTPVGGFEAFEASAMAPFVDYLTRRQNVSGVLVGDGTAVTGGFVYRGSAIPELNGMYVFGDYSIAGSPPAGIPANKARLFYVDPADPIDTFEFQYDIGFDLVGQLLGFGRDDEGELYAFFDNGNVTRIVTSPSGDFDSDGDVDGDDLAQWQGDYGIDGGSDADGDGDSDGRDFLTWQRNFGSTIGPMSAGVSAPEPSTALLLAGVSLAVGVIVQGRFSRPSCDV
jgi:glucose/arabinose dehydrogenase